MAPAAPVEDEDDAPTTIMQHSSEMMEDLRRMATGDDAAQAAPVATAPEKPAAAKPTAPAPARAAKPAAEEKGGSKAGLVVLLLLAAGAAAAWGLGLF